MNYTIQFTQTAEQDVIEAADYIEFILYNPTAADKLLDDIEETLNELAYMPETHAVVDDPVLMTWGIRFVKVNNNLAFYVIDEKSKIVYIVRFLYFARDWAAILTDAGCLRNGAELDKSDRE